MKRCLALLMALLILVALCSCNRSGTSSASSSSPTPSSPSSEIISSDPSSSETSSQLPPSSETPPSSNVTSSEITSSEEEEYISPFTPVSYADRWNYNKITTTQKAIYDEIYNAAKVHFEGKIELGNVTQEDIAIADYAVRCDHPELFWLPGSFWMYSEDGGQTYSLSYTDEESNSGYLCFVDEEPILSKAMQDKVTEFLKTVSAEMTEYELALAAHNFLAKTVEYDHEAAEDHSQNPYSFTAYGALVAGKAVCEGYAKAYKLLLNSMGIDCITVTGTLDSVGHMWNMAKLGGDWYNIDVTSDDQDDLIFIYFNQTDAFLLANKYVFDESFSEHIKDGQSFNISKPEATATILNYHNVSGFIIDNPIPDIEDQSFNFALKEAVKNGKTHIDIRVDVEDISGFNFEDYVRSQADFSVIGDDITVRLIRYPDKPNYFRVSWQTN